MTNEIVLGSEFKSEPMGTKREIIRGMLTQCTEAQQNLFNRMYVSIDDIEDEKLNTAYDQCKRTLDKNTSKGKCQ